ncbi:MAG: hypothetical protein ABI477_17995 [Chryseolinea sp.]
MKKPLIAVMLFLSTYANAQDLASKFDFRFGVGTSLLSSGDMKTVMFENELNYFINNFLSTSLSAGYGKSNSGVFETSSFVQGNLNVFISPFKNNNRNDFRIGTGISYMNVSDTYHESANYDNGIMIDEDYIIDKRNTIGMNIVLENTYTLHGKVMLGVKLFTQPYKNGDINSGVLLKLGLKI